MVLGPVALVVVAGMRVRGWGLGLGSGRDMGSVERGLASALGQTLPGMAWEFQPVVQKELMVRARAPHSRLRAPMGSAPVGSTRMGRVAPATMGRPGCCIGPGDDAGPRVRVPERARQARQAACVVASNRNCRKIPQREEERVSPEASE